MPKTRDVNAAWNNAKRQVVREHPDWFSLDGKVLRRATAMEDRPREILLTGFTNGQLVERVSALLNARYTARQATYDLRRLKRKVLIAA